MKRNLTQIELISPGATTWLPWVDDISSNRLNGYPDFSGYNGASRAVRETAWQEFLDSGQELEVVSDPVTPINDVSTPNWLQFYKQLKISNTYQHLIGLTIQAPNISGVMAALGIAIQDGIRDPQDPDILPAFQAGINGVLTALSVIGQQLTAEQLSEIRTLLDDNGFTSITLGG